MTEVACHGEYPTRLSPGKNRNDVVYYDMVIAKEIAFCKKTGQATQPVQVLAPLRVRW